MHPTANLERVIDSLVFEGHDQVLSKLMPLMAVNTRADRCASDIDLVRSAWNLEELAQSYDGFVQKYEPIRLALADGGQGDWSEEDAFLVRTLLIHDVRRLLLRDPKLPESLLPAAWPGSRARQLCRDLYRKLLPPSERHLDAKVRLSSGAAPQAAKWLASRFEYEIDPGEGAHRAD